MNNLLVIKKIMLLSLTMMLTLVTLHSTVGSAIAQENRADLGRPSQGQGPTKPTNLRVTSLTPHRVTLAWKDGYWGVAFRVYYTLVTVAAVAFVWFLNTWNLLGWRF